ncbi:MAG: hypothetical protein PHC74_02175, partial [Sulfurimonas sp.]|nr:hypothetical protein [Sulfurimonas sp.]
IVTGKTYVQTNPAEFHLVTAADAATQVTTATTAATAAGIVTGRDMVIASPVAYGLVSQADLNSSVSDALATGVASGKQYVQDNLPEFGLVVKANMELTPSNIASLSTGWTLISTPFAITDLSVFDSAAIVWVYNNTASSWSAYSSNAAMRQKIIDNASVNLLTTVPAGSGVWVQK